MTFDLSGVINRLPLLGSKGPRDLKRRVRGMMGMDLVGKEQWGQYGSHIPQNMRDGLQEKIGEVLRQTFFQFIRDEEWKNIMPGITQEMIEFRSALKIKGNSVSWMDRWIYYLSGDGEFIHDPARMRGRGLTPEAVAQTWAVALWAFSNADMKSLLGEAAFDIGLSRESDIMELWILSGTLVGEIAYSVCPVLRGNPYRHLYAVYAAGLRPLVFRDLKIAVPLENAAGSRTVQVYELSGDDLLFLEERTL
jgi:hypothetical protein